MSAQPAAAILVSTVRRQQMSQTTDIQKKDSETLEQELEQLQAAEANLERKTRDMWSAEVVALVMAFIALILGAAGFALGLSKTGGTTTVMMRGAGTGSGASAATRTTMPGAAAGMMGNRTAANTGAAGARTVNVTLGEMYVRPSRTTISAGKVTFAAKNVGMLQHELMIERAPVKMSSPGHPVEDAAMGMIDDMGHMGTGKMTLKLTPGTYVLFCNVSGHYAAGQHTLFTVTKS
jgi:uncharacterized cupredoxin-like copper-binding protein